MGIMDVVFEKIAVSKGMGCRYFVFQKGIPFKKKCGARIAVDYQFMNLNNTQPVPKIQLVKFSAEDPMAEAPGHSVCSYKGHLFRSAEDKFHIIKIKA